MFRGSLLRVAHHATGIKRTGRSGGATVVDSRADRYRNPVENRAVGIHISVSIIIRGRQDKGYIGNIGAAHETAAAIKPDRADDAVGWKPKLPGIAAGIIRRHTPVHFDF